MAEDIKKYAASQSISMLMGSGYYWDVKMTSFMVVETKLNWIVQGPAQQSKVTLTSAGSYGTPYGSHELQRFWSLEFIGIETKTSD